MSAVAKLLEIESKSLAKKALTVAAQAQARQWRGIGFRLGNADLVTSMASVLEVLTPAVCTKVPASEQWFEGIANVRGQLVPVSDLHGFIHGKRLPVDRNTRVLVFKMASSVTGLIVNGVTGIRSFDEGSMDQKYPSLDARLRPFVTGCFHRAGDDYPVFDFNRLVSNERFMHIMETKQK